MSDEPSRIVVRALVRELVHTERPASREELARIRDLMATAPFDATLVPVRVADRGRRYGIIVLERRARSIDYHMVKRIMVDGQWRIGTTAPQYVEDLRTAIQDAATRIDVFEQRGGVISVAIAATSVAVPANRLEPSPLESLLVVYSADRDIIVSGYQFSSMEEVSIPEEARWLT